ncbi:MAG: 2,3-bisphosphoglycerate-dependent phosphoglycerate mutase, partial [Proteobacteria bacterium]|nr:2,3-bisphosphoglycerate-dependent phosphoglycerate mutase [Pseudomonadota bacterium]
KNLNINFNFAFTSFQKRAILTLDEINKKLDLSIKNIFKAWELNERHYGALQGLNKEETAKKHGEQQVKIWRRSYDIPPPPMDKDNPDHPVHYPIYKNINKNLIPDTESLKDTFKRVIPYYEKNILPVLKKEKNVIISAHGNSLRSLCKKIFNITDGSIVELEIPTGNPIHITFKDDMTLSKYLYLDHKRAKKILINE